MFLTNCQTCAKVTKHNYLTGECDEELQLGIQA
jgi:hypothetical protein